MTYENHKKLHPPFRTQEIKVPYLSKYKTMFIVYMGIRKKERSSHICILQKHCNGVNALHHQWYTASNNFRQEILLFYGIFCLLLQAQGTIITVQKKPKLK
jgi:hypothetical protein